MWNGRVALQKRILLSSDTVCRVVSSLLQTSSSGLEKLGVVHLSVKLCVELFLLYPKRLLVVCKNWENFAFQLKLCVELCLLYSKRLLVVWKNWENFALQRSYCVEFQAGGTVPLYKFRQ